MTPSEWAQECNYISRQTDQFVLRDRALEFVGDKALFIRYCVMQRNSATREGFHDSAQYIQHCIDDLTGEPIHDHAD